MVRSVREKTAKRAKNKWVPHWGKCFYLTVLTTFECTYSLIGPWIAPRVNTRSPFFSRILSQVRVQFGGRYSRLSFLKHEGKGMFWSENLERKWWLAAFSTILFHDSYGPSKRSATGRIPHRSRKTKRLGSNTSPSSFLRQFISQSWFEPDILKEKLSVIFSFEVCLDQRAHFSWVRWPNRYSTP